MNYASKIAIKESLCNFYIMHIFIKKILTLAYTIHKSQNHKWFYD